MPRLPVALLLLFPAFAFAQRNAKVPDPDPELERKTFVLPEGFEVNLFAADPMLAKPIQMNFDSKGRLWVAASEVYPQIKPGEKANDKVLILEDKDGDGKADSTTVFADGLLIPTAVEPDQFGGAWVADSTDMVHFSEPGKDGKARKRRIVLSGFGTEDTHHILHTFRTGPDCRLYMSQSIYIHSHIETPHGVRRLNAGGIWQYQPQSEKLEVFARGWVNTWGTAWNKHGTTFATDGAGGEGINYVVPGAAYVTARDVARILPGLNPGSPKYCGLEVVSGRHLPDDWQQNLITNDFRGHRVCRYIVQEDGSGFVAKEQKELIKSTHPAFRPIDVKMGPDGAIYIADWYNPIIQHGEVDFRDERRDKTHGRIWRVTYKGRKLVERPKISGATIEELIELLMSPEDWTRSHARRELATRDVRAVNPKLMQWAKGQADPRAKLESVWVSQAQDLTPMRMLLELARDPNADVRAAVWRVLGEFSDRDTEGELLQKPIDEHPRVRLEQVRALAKVKGSASTIASALDKPVDRWLDYAIWLSLRETKDEWLPKVKAGTFDFGADPKKLVFALRAAGEGDVSKPLYALLDNGKLTAEQRSACLLTLASMGNTNDIVAVLDRVSGDPAGRATALTAFERAVRERKVAFPKGEWERFKQIINNDTGAGRQAACRLMGLWKVEEARRILETLASTGRLATEATGEDRTAAFEGIALLGGPKAVEFLEVSAKQNFDLKRVALLSLVSVDTTKGAALAAETLKAETVPANAEPIFTAFLGRKGGTAELAKAIAATPLSADVARTGVRLARSTAAPDQTLIDALTKAGKLTETKRVVNAQLLENVKAKGDPVRGEKVYRRAEMNCLKCHAVAGAGGRVGPDMTSIGASAQVDYLVESLLNPNAKIKEGYNSLVVETADGQTRSGVKVRENQQELVLRDAEDREISIPKADKPDVKNGKSLMPEGLTDSLTDQEFLDLVRFLSELGKGEYLAQPGKVVRRWEAVMPTQPLFTVVTRDRLGAVATSKELQWAPAYSRVQGELPVDELPKWKIGQGAEQAVVRFQLDVTTAGKARLLLLDVTGVQLWLDGTPLATDKDMVVDLSAGVRTVTVHVKMDERTTPLRVELAEVKDSPARVQVVGGK
ncbi:MAG: HEAT repeat domain-containing protein [Fimbriiglobus sp.]|nr:HEAT repeat domain-containing protein [Fimbriiglobus sp.]